LLGQPAKALSKEVKKEVTEKVATLKQSISNTSVLSTPKNIRNTLKKDSKKLFKGFKNIMKNKD
jgi:uncharacterized protein (UPF0147 family)